MVKANVYIHCAKRMAVIKGRITLALFNGTNYPTSDLENSGIALKRLCIVSKHMYDSLPCRARNF